MTDQMFLLFVCRQRDFTLNTTHSPEYFDMVFIDVKMENESSYALYYWYAYLLYLKKTDSLFEMNKNLIYTEINTKKDFTIHIR